MPTQTLQIENAANIEKLIRRALERIKVTVEKNMDINRRNASMQSVRSLTITTTPVSGVLMGSRSFLFMERGRGAGAIPRGFHNIIKRWLMAKKIQLTDGSNIDSVSYAIAQTIARKGTRLHRNHTTQNILSATINTQVAELHTEILRTVSGDVELLTQEFIKTP